MTRVSALTAWVAGLEPREQRLLKWAAPLVLVMLVVLFWPDASKEDDWLLPVTERTPQQQLVEVESFKLAPVARIDVSVWQTQAARLGLNQVSMEPQGEHWVMQAKVQTPQSIEAFARWAAEQGWYWQRLEFSGQPIQLEIVWVAR